MTKINKTLIATSAPISVCKGLALFPQIGTSRAGVSASGTTGSIFSTKDTLLLWRLTADAGYDVFMGLCGPAYAVEMDVEGEADKGQVELTVSGDELQAGFFFGLTVGLHFSIDLEQYTTRIVWKGWHSHLESKWENVASIGPSIEVDMIDLILTVILLALEESGQEDTLLQKVDKFTPKLLGSWGMYDEQKNTFVENGGKMVAKPTFNIPIDITSMVPALKAVNESLKAFFCHFGTGPQIGVQIPVTVELNKIKLDSTEYADLSFSKGKVSGKTAGTDPSAPKELGLTLNHTPNFDLTLGVFASLQICKLFNVSGSVSIPILSMLGISPKLGTYSNDLKNDIGSESVASCGCGSLKGARLVEVIFDEPLVAGA